MTTLQDKTAFITGGASGIGLAIARALLDVGAHVALADVEATALERAKKSLTGLGGRVTTHVLDVTDRTGFASARDAAIKAHGAVHLLFNNAGIGGGGSLVVNGQDEWERTFNVCWGGVYNGTRAFLPLMLKADAGHIVNTSSVNGFWAFIAPHIPQTAYSAAKFAVKGFTEALITDLRINAPHIKCSVVMPGHIGTSIVANSRKVQSGNESDVMTPKEIAQARARITSMGRDAAALSDDEVRKIVADRARRFLEEAPTSAAEAARIILDGVKAERWRILVGRDAERIDSLVRATPERAYDTDFYEAFEAETGWRVGR